MFINYLKFGGVAFETLADPKEINQYVENLSDEDRESLYEVALELEKKGMIKLLPEMSTTEDDSCL